MCKLNTVVWNSLSSSRSVSKKELGDLGEAGNSLWVEKRAYFKKKLLNVASDALSTNQLTVKGNYCGRQFVAASYVHILTKAWLSPKFLANFSKFSLMSDFFDENCLHCFKRNIVHEVCKVKVIFIWLRLTSCEFLHSLLIHVTREYKYTLIYLVWII